MPSDLPEASAACVEGDGDGEELNPFSPTLSPGRCADLEEEDDEDDTAERNPFSAMLSLHQSADLKEEDEDEAQEKEPLVDLSSSLVCWADMEEDDDEGEGQTPAACERRGRPGDYAGAANRVRPKHGVSEIMHIFNPCKVRGLSWLRRSCSVCSLHFHMLAAVYLAVPSAVSVIRPFRFVLGALWKWL